MLHRRPPGGGSSASSSPAPASAPGPSNTAYTPLRRRESAGLYPTPSSATKARYPLPSPGLGGYPSPIASVGSPNMLGLSSPINIGGQPNAYGYSGGAGGQYGGGNTFDLSSEGAGKGREAGDMKEVILGGIRRAVERSRRGVADAMRLDRSWNLAWKMINLLSLLLLSFFSIVVSPSLGPALSDSRHTKEIGMWYNLLLSWPVFAVCFWVNSSWGPRISRRAQTLLHPSYRHQPSPASTPVKPTFSTPSSLPDPSALISPLFKGVARIMLIADFTLMSRLISIIPVVGRALGFGYMCIITGYYCFEGWSLDHRVSYVQERTAYMLAFGLIPTFLTSLSTPLINMSIFALLYPFFVIQALVSRPPGLSASSITSPGSSLPPTPTEPSSGGGGNNPFFAERDMTNGWRGRVGAGVPMFVLARYGLEVLGWFEGAVGRKLGGGARKERAGKRLG